MKTLKSACGAAALAALCAAGPARADGPCSQTAAAVANACQNEAGDDYWIAVGHCRNEPAGAGPECLARATSERDEALQICGEQSAARLDLCGDLGEAAYDPAIDPSQFLSPAATAANPNPYFPLVPGTRWVYRGPDETIVVTVTRETKRIQGVRTIVVHDVVVDDEGKAVEDTEDFFAQHSDGTVWYFGELSQSFDEDGELESLDGSFRAGKDSAKAGIIMKAAPTAGQIYRQEFALGDAEDAAEVLRTNGHARVPGGSCRGRCVVTRDFTPIEPGQEERKFYAPGIGLILEINPGSGERTVLQEFRRGG